MADDHLSFEAHRRRRDRASVPCARCNKPIPGTVVRCPRCGIHFNGRAEDFAPGRRGSILGPTTWVIVVAVLLLALTAASIFRAD